MVQFRYAGIVLLAGLVVFGSATCGGNGGIDSAKEAELKALNKAYATFEMEVPWQLLDDSEKAALEKLYQAAALMDELFFIQVSPDNIAMKEEFERSGSPEEIRFFRINFGPWNRLEADEPVLCDYEKPPGANFYPPEMTKEEFEAWVESHPGDAEAFESTFTTIRRTDGGGLKAVPYPEEYGERLARAARYLEQAADLTRCESLAKFLRARAASFLSNDYYESDMAWMDVEDNVLDVTIGPYEVYEDNLFGYKAAFEAFICVRDPEESRKLDGLKGYILEMEKNLPIEDKHKNLDRGLDSPISVVDEIFAAGDTKAGPQTLAFNLPNDERVRDAKGSKKVMLRNVCRAKFEKILKPIAGEVLAKDQLPLVTFDAYFNHILLHEFTHGLGPGNIVMPDGRKTTVNKMLQEANSAIEEAKADVGGQYNFYYLIDDGFFPAKLREETAVTYLAGFFRSVRFGVEAPHGRANMIAFNYFKEKGAYKCDPGTNLWSVDLDLIGPAVKDLFHELLMLQATGDYEGAKSFIARYGEMGEDVKASIDKLETIPVDIEPVFALQKEIGGR